LSASLAEANLGEQISMNKTNEMRISFRTVSLKDVLACQRGQMLSIEDNKPYRMNPSL
jgi:hypothetical protein